jgi:predicted ArsR family transcriptional regulator
MASDAGFDDRVHGIAALDQPLRRRIYALLADRRCWLSRDDVADTIGLARSVAAFHLERLADAGLVDVRHARTSGRSGPGAGRPAKFYRRAEQEINVSVPERDYGLAGLLLARAIDDATRTGRPVEEALADAAYNAGREFGTDLRADRGGLTSEAVISALETRGYEPREIDREIVLKNCPFHALAEEHRALVCGMNLRYLSGLLESMAGGPSDARLDYEPGYCCVRLTTQTPSA